MAEKRNRSRRLPPPPPPPPPLPPPPSLMRRKNRGEGWSSLTRRNTVAAIPLPPPLPAPSEFIPLVVSNTSLPPAHYPPEFDSPPHLPSFSSALKRNIAISEEHMTVSSASASVSASPSPNLDLVASRLKSLHPWADNHLILDVLHALHLDQEQASSYLSSISDEAATTPRDDHHLEKQKTEEDQNSLGFGHVPVEPEWVVENDIYHSSRREALKMSRASGKHSRGAQKAFIKGEYAKANMLSKKAKEERIEAERLHNEAAKKIFEAQNTESKRELWELDLHGLHVNEAVAALCNRLLCIEALLSENNCASEEVSSWDSNGSGSTADKIALRAEMVAEIRPPRLPFGRRLNVITGVGNHSRDGGSLPIAIRTFLIQHRYTFEESRPGTLVVNPKFHFMKDKSGTIASMGS